MLGAGTNHWFHSDQVYRAILQLVALCGCQGVNGGGWAHYVGQEKVRPISGLVDARVRPRLEPAAAAAGNDAVLVPRERPVPLPANPGGRVLDAARQGVLDGMHVADCNVLAARLGWMPSYPTFDRNPLELTREAASAGVDLAAYVVERLRDGVAPLRRRGPGRAGELPARPDALARQPARLLEQGPRVLSPPRARRRGRRRAKRGAAPDERPNEVVWREEAPTREVRPVHDDRLPHERVGALLGRRPARRDVVREARPLLDRPASVRPLVQPGGAAAVGGAHGLRHLRPGRRAVLGARRDAPRYATDLVAAPLLHDTPDELAQPFGEVRDWKRGECEPVPGKTMPKLVPVERDYTAVYRKWRASGRSPRSSGRRRRESRSGRPARSRSSALRTASSTDARALTRDVHMCEAILALSGVSNGRLAVEGFRGLEKRTGTRLADIAEEHADVRITFGDTQVQPRKVIASPEWSGMESRDRRYNPFTINVERDVPFRTLTGRQQLYVEHAWMLEYGEGLPIYRPPLNVLGVVGEQLSGDPTRKELHLRWLSPHSKWSIHSEFQDNLHMLTCSVADRSCGSRTWTRGDRGRRQRLGRGLQPERRRRRARGRLAPHPVGRGHDVPLAGPARERPAQRALGHARRHRQLRHPHLDEADAPDRRLRAALLRLQLLRPVRHAARRDGRRAKALGEVIY